MKVAIANGWLVFDNELESGEEACNPFKHVRGRVRLADVCSYTRAKVYNGWGDAGGWPLVTMVWERGQEAPWHVRGDHQELLDGYFGSQR
jgi:hypothetical protein